MQSGCISNGASVSYATVFESKVDFEHRIDSTIKVNTKYTTGDSINIISVNHPLFGDESFDMVVYANSCVLYFGKFKKNLKVFFPKDFENKNVHFSVELFKNDTLYVLENKSVSFWRQIYKYVYIVYFPNDKSDEPIWFFPQELME